LRNRRFAGRQGFDYLFEREAEVVCHLEHQLRLAAGQQDDRWFAGAGGRTT
jgi:hypothetical protein